MKTPSLGLLLTTAVLLNACGGGGGPAGSEPGACTALPDGVTWFTGPQSNEWNDVAIDRDHRIWLAGYADGTLGTGHTDPGGNSRGVLRVLAPGGRVQWESGSQFDTPGTDVLEAVALTAQGSVYAAGRTDGAFAGATNAGQFDTFVAWSDRPAAAGAWRIFQTGSERPQRPRRIRANEQGQLHVAGYDDDYIPTNYLAAYSDPFALHLTREDAGGAGDRLQARWSHQFDTAAADVVDGTATFGQGTDAVTYLAGSTLTGNERGMFVRKLGASGNTLWTVRYPGTPIDQLAAVLALADGSVLIGGTTYGAFHGGTPQGEQDVFVARIAADDGRVLASWQFGTAGPEMLTDMTRDAAGNIVLLGDTLGSFVPGQPSAGGIDMFMLKVSPNGELLASTQWGTAESEAARHVAVDACGRAVAVGHTTLNAKRAGVMWSWRAGN